LRNEALTLTLNPINVFRSIRRPARLQSVLRSKTLTVTFCAGAALALAGACKSSNDEPPARIGSGGTDSGQGSSGGASNNAGAGGSGSSVGHVGGFGGTQQFIQDGDADLGPDAGGLSCATSAQEAVLIPANVLFLIDRSGSMNCNPPEGDADLNADCALHPVKQNVSEPSKWEVTREALRGALDSLGGKPNVSVGISVFPKPDAVENCLVAEAPDVAIDRLDTVHRAAIDSFLDGVTPRGDTPIAGTTILGYRYLSDRVRSGELTGNTFVVLFTDGAETCDGQYLSQLVDHDVPLATQFNIKTFVIGAPGSEDGRALLSQVAYNGLTARSASCDHSAASASVGDCHFDMTTSTDFAGELASALQAIAGDASLSCQLDIPRNPSGGGVDLNQVNVTFSTGAGEVISVLRDDSACEGGADGWQYSGDGSKIILCGPTCDRARNDGGEIEIVLGCPTQKAPLR
jgi:hypothetical protein